MDLTDLLKQKKAALKDRAASLNLPSYDRLTKRELALSIVAKTAQNKAIEGETQEQPPEVQQSDELPDNRDFENIDVLSDGQEKEERRGGSRPGAGRPKGSTAEICAVRNLPEQPHESVKAALQSLFALWAFKSNIEEVNLTEDEAVQIALPVTQIIELHAPGKIPQEFHIYIMAVWSSWSIAAAKIKLIKSVRPDFFKQVSKKEDKANDTE